MWTKSRFAQWEVEGQIQERINYARHQAELGRLARMARGTEVGPVRRGWRWLVLRGKAGLDAARSALVTHPRPGPECC